jgi:hypothetical protein
VISEFRQRPSPVLSTVESGRASALPNIAHFHAISGAVVGGHSDHEGRTWRMLRTVVLGVTLSIVVGLLVRFAPLGLDTTSTVVLGACLGAVLAVIRDREPWQRVLAFGAGVAATWLSYAARAGLLPDEPTGRAIAVFVVLLLVTGISVATLGRLPLWAGLLGVAGFAGSYEIAFAEQPTSFATQSVVALSTLAFAAGAGYALSAVLVEVVPDRIPGLRRDSVDLREPSPTVPEQPTGRLLPQPVEAEEVLRGPRVIDLPRGRSEA